MVRYNDEGNYDITSAVDGSTVTITESELLDAMFERTAALCAEDIETWVRANFGQGEVDDPSWNIEQLARWLAKRFYA